MSNVIIPQPVNTEQADFLRALTDAQLFAYGRALFARPDEQQTDPDADRERVSDGARACREDEAAGVA